MKRLLMGVAALWVFVVLAVGLASAQTPEKIAEHFFEKGNTAYNLGRWDEAAEHFTKAYEAWAQPEFLYNIAQSYRQGGNCKQALHFYKRFKSLKEDDKKAPLSKQKRDEIDKFIKQLTECAAKADSSATTKPDTIDPPPRTPTTTTTTTPVTTTPTTTPPTTPTTTTTTTTTKPTTTTPTTTTTTTTPPQTTGGLEDPNEEEEEEEDDTSVSTSTTVAGPQVVSARAMTGVALLASGDLNMPPQPSFGIVAGYPLAVGPATLELGAGFSYSPLPYEAMGAQKQGMLIGARAVVGAAYPVAPKFLLRGELGVGIVALNGLEMGNPIVDDRSAQGFTLLNVRLGVSADYLITSNIAATVSPFGIAFSPGADGMYGDSLREINVLVGLGYRQ